MPDMTTPLAGRANPARQEGRDLLLGRVVNPKDRPKQAGQLSTRQAAMSAAQAA